MMSKRGESATVQENPKENLKGRQSWYNVKGKRTFCGQQMGEEESPKCKWTIAFGSVCMWE